MYVWYGVMCVLWYGMMKQYGVVWYIAACCDVLSCDVVCCGLLLYGVVRYATDGIVCRLAARRPWGGGGEDTTRATKSRVVDLCRVQELN